MPRRRRPIWAQKIGYALDLDEQSPDFDHPAAKPLPGSDKCFLVDLLDVPKKDQKVYDAFSRICGLLALNVATAYVSKTGKVSCIHPLAFTCKRLRREFLAFFTKYPPPTLARFKAQVNDFKFKNIKGIIDRYLQLKFESEPLSVKIYHAITRSDMDVENFLAWTKFVAIHSTRLNTRHKVIDMPSPENRLDFLNTIWNLESPRVESNWKTKEIERIVHDSKQWWDSGAGRYDFVSPGYLEKNGIDLQAYPEDVREEKERLNRRKFSLDDYHQELLIDAAAERDEMEVDGGENN